MAPKPSAAAAPKPALAPAVPSAQEDEHRGLAGRIIELRAVVEEHRKQTVRDVSEIREMVIRVEHRQGQLQSKLDQAMTDIDRRQRELDQALREGAEQVRAAGQMAREMKAKATELEELREMAADPHDVVKPVQRAIAQVAADLETLRKAVDHKFEQLPRQHAEPWEGRGSDEVERGREFERGRGR